MDRMQRSYLSRALRNCGLLGKKNMNLFRSYGRRKVAHRKVTHGGMSYIVLFGTLLAGMPFHTGVARKINVHSIRSRKLSECVQIAAQKKG